MDFLLASRRLTKTGKDKIKIFINKRRNKMKKKVITLCIVAALALAVVVGGTIALSNCVN